MNNYVLTPSIYAQWHTKVGVPFYTPCSTKSTPCAFLLNFIREDHVHDGTVIVTHLRWYYTKFRRFFRFWENAKSKVENILRSIQNDVFAKTALFYGVFGMFSTNFVGRAGKYWELVNDFL